MQEISHIALLTEDVNLTAKAFAAYDFHIGAAEEFPGEGTKEIYIGQHEVNNACLLLMQPMAEGSYMRALKKRGPGLHHIGIDVANIETYLDSLSGSGWLLTPGSLANLNKLKTVWLCRPGFPTLIEVHERSSQQKPNFISKLEIPLSNEFHNMLKTLGLDNVVVSDDDNYWITIKDQRISLNDLLPLKKEKTDCYAVIFSSQRKDDNNAEYELMAEKMVDLAKQQIGFLDVESVRDKNGSGITISYWKSIADIQSWKENSEHLLAQKLGREKWYESYSVRVCKVEQRNWETRVRN